MPLGYDDFDRTVLRHRDYIRRLCWWHAGGDEQRCAELVQMVLVQLWEYRDKLRPDAGERQVHAWVRYHCRSVFSHQQRRHRPPEVSIDKVQVAAPVDERRETLLDLAVDLTPHEMEVLQMILDGYSAAEIAQTLGIKPHSVSQLRLRIIEKMKKRYHANQRH